MSGPISPAPLAVWLGIQWAGLCIAAGRVPLAARYAQPGEFQAISLLVAVQFGTLALLFPWLLSGVAMALGTIGAAWLMLLSAAVVAACPLVDVVSPGMFLSLWIVALTAVRAALPARLYGIGSALLAVYFIGGPLLAYFRLEYATRPAPFDPIVIFGPLYTAITTSHHLPPLAWVEPALLVPVAATLGFSLKIAHRSAPLSPTGGA